MIKMILKCIYYLGSVLQRLYISVQITSYLDARSEMDLYHLNILNIK